MRNPAAFLPPHGTELEDKMRVRKRCCYSGQSEFPMHGYITKPGNDERFFKGWSENRLEYVCYSPKGYMVFLLREDSSKALKARIVGKLNYDPATDIDRYLVECLALKRLIPRCAVFEELKTWLGELKERMAVGPDQESINGDGTPYIDYGDGSVGPISAKPDGGVDFRAKALALDAICENCEYRGNNAAGCGDGRENAIRVCKERKYEGIIAKIGSWFKKKGEA